MVKIKITEISKFINFMNSKISNSSVLMRNISRPQSAMSIT